MTRGLQFQCGRLCLRVSTGLLALLVCTVAAAGVSTQTGLIEIGRTNADGEFNIAKKFLAEQGIQALLFCPGKQPFPCAAVRLDDPGILGFDELNVQIPFYTTIDRVRIN